MPEPIRIQSYSPRDEGLDYSHPDFLYEGNKYRTLSETKAIQLDEQIA